VIQVVLLRHAPTPWNADRRIQGRSDIRLSPGGAAEAARWRLPEDAAAWRCLSSPLLRAVETAEAMGLSPETAAAFVEMDWGGYEGRRLAELRQEFGAAFAAKEARGLDFRPPGGESPREVGERAFAGLAALREDSVVVTHKGVLRPLFALATGWDMRGDPIIKIRDRCCHRFALDAGVLRLVEPNIPLGGDAPSGADTSTGTSAGPDPSDPSDRPDQTERKNLP
jgi:probable phosphoglycerate mutase